jgi:protein-tyrosine phosphatase
VFDLHTHILPGLDDGPATLDESLEIARAAVADGIELVAATPHVRSDFPTRPERMEAAVEELRAELARAEIPLEVRTGGEVALPELDRDPTELRRFGLGGNRAYLLVEFPYFGWPLDLADRLFRLAASGITPVIAHPERSAEVQADPQRLRPLVEAGALVQVTAASIDGRIGPTSQRTGLGLIADGLAHVLASDAHLPAIRGIGMTAAVETLGDVRLARWLSREVPEAIVRRQPLPARPGGRGRRWFSPRAAG